MSENARHHIPISKAKCGLYLIPGTIFGFSGPYAAYCVFVQGQNLGLAYALWLLLSPISIPVCMPAMFSLARKLFNPKAGLTLTDGGIHNDSSPFGSYYVKWAEVQSIHRTPNSIELRSNLAEGFSSFLKAGRKSSKKPRTKVNITNDCLQASYEEIVGVLRAHQSNPIGDERKRS